MKLWNIIKYSYKWSLLVITALSFLSYGCCPSARFYDRKVWLFDDGSLSAIKSIKNSAGKSTVVLLRPTVVELRFSMPTDTHVNIDSLRCIFDNSEEPFYLKSEHFYMYTLDTEGKRIMTIGMAKDLIYSIYSKNKRTYKDTDNRYLYILPCSFLTKGGVSVLNDTIKVKWW